MKELSTEEKARRYDEAIEVARKIKNGDPINVPDGTLIPVAIFPELKESDDDRIKSAAIEFVIQNHSFNYYLGVSKDDVITWIEEQCGQKLVWSEGDKNMLKWVIGYLENKMLNTPISEERTACKNAIAWLLEKQGEQKPNPCDGCINRKGCINCENGELRETEQEPAKVEPKFKVGEWITNGEFTWYIKRVGNGFYDLKSPDRGVVDDTISYVDEHFHLWTIQDAKDGDVLNSMRVQATIIFKGFADDGKHILAYCALQKGIFIKQEMLWDRDFEPCQKNWNNELFQKMKEAGYTWDVEKKELKKIEQKPAAWSKKDARLLDNCISLIEDIDCTEKEQNWLKDIKDRIQPQLQWSEEDETKIKSIIALLKNPAVCAMDGNKGIINASIKYLKFLRYRVQPQPKQEWSEEDDRMRKAIIDSIKAICEEGYLVGNIGSDKLIDWLDSLKDRVQPQWKPSYEHIKVLEAMLTVSPQSPAMTSALIELYQQLKKLREE